MPFQCIHTRWLRTGAAALSLLLLMALPAASSVVRQQTPPAGTTIMSGLMWALENNGADVNWATATQYCEDLKLANHEDWRLPTIQELAALYDANSTAESKIRSPFRLTNCCLWSSTQLQEGDDPDPRRRLDPSRYAYGFYFPNGERYYSATGFPDGRAQCVRAAQ